MAFEDNVANILYSQQNEKTVIDKVLAKSDVDRLREIIKKDKLTRSELLEILYLLSGNESKLCNYGEYERYIVLKFFVWVREYVKVAELLYDYTDDLENNQNFCLSCNLPFKQQEGLNEICKCEKPIKRQRLTGRCKQILANNQRLMEHNVKFLIDLYLNITRTGLSLGGTGFMELLKNKFEIAYPQQSNLNTPMQQEKKGFFSFSK